MAGKSTSEHVKVVAQGNTQFSGNLHNVLKKDHAGNLIYSPFSLSAVLAMAHAGTRANTSAEIKATLQVSVENEVLNQGYSEVLSSLQEKNEGYTLATANRLYVQGGFKVKSEFTDTLSKSFHAESEQLDFGKSEESAAKINEWVQGTTHDKIKNLIQPSALGPLTRLVLVNGIYFKGVWANQFDPKFTKKTPFHLNNAAKVDVDMMFKQANFPYTVLEDMDAHAVALPYKGERLQMLVIVPKEIEGLAKIEAGLVKNFNPQTIFESMTTNMKVAISLPRFKLESTLDLVEPLKKLGLTSIFSDGSDFSGISESESLYVSAVVQKAFIEVNEEGSEAAAATGMVIMTRCMPIVIPFNADKPFYIQIVDTFTNFVLFSGACVNPTSA